MDITIVAEVQRAEKTLPIAILVTGEIGFRMTNPKDPAARKKWLGEQRQKREITPDPGLADEVVRREQRTAGAACRGL
jgi:hypothetical protein